MTVAVNEIGKMKKTTEENGWPRLYLIEIKFVSYRDEEISVPVVFALLANAKTTKRPRTSTMTNSSRSRSDRQGEFLLEIFHEFSRPSLCNLIFYLCAFVSSFIRCKIN